MASGLYIAGSLLVLVFFLVNPGINHYPPSLFDRTVDGTADKPYVLRALVPVTIRVVAAVVPASVRYFAALFFFTLGLGLMFRRRWTAYLVVFFLSCLNKETTILLTIVFWLNFRDGELPDRQFRGLLLSQIGGFILIKGALGYIYRNNPGGTLEFHLVDNIDLLKPYDLATAVALLVLFLLLTYRWSEKPLFLRRGLWIAAPLFGLTLFLGLFDELRDYYELFPIMLLLVAHSFGNIVGLGITTRSKLPVASGPSSLRQVPQLTAVAAVGVGVLLAAASVATSLVNVESVRPATPVPTAAVSANKSVALSPAAHDAFVRQLTGETPSSAWIEYDARDAGVRQLAEELGAGFEEAHWKVRVLRPSTFPLRAGVFLLVAEEASRTTDAVSQALVSADVHHTVAQDYRASGERRQREEPNWRGPTFTQDQAFLLVVGRSALERNPATPATP